MNKKSIGVSSGQCVKGGMNDLLKTQEERMRYFHRCAVAELEQRGDGKMRYAAPNPFMFAVTAAGMLLAFDLALAGPFASNWDRDVVGTSPPARWGVVRTLTFGKVNLESIQKRIFNIFAERTTGNNLIPFTIGIGGAAKRIFDVANAVHICRRHKATTAITVKYAIGVFFSGSAQMIPLKDEVYRIHRLNRQPHIGYENLSQHVADLLHVKKPAGVSPTLSAESPATNSSGDCSFALTNSSDGGGNDSDRNVDDHHANAKAARRDSVTVTTSP